MRMTLITPLVAVAVFGAADAYRLSAANAPKPGVDWPQFRGISANGVSENGSTPTTWDVGKGTNVIWKTPIPGLGLSSPVVWGDRIYLSTAISGKSDATLKPGLYGDIASVPDDTSHEWKIYAINKKTGAIAWETKVTSGVPKVKRHLKSTHANSTLATDGERIVAFFGSEGLYAFDMNGKQLWKKDLGVLDAGFYMAPEAQWETGSSPIIHDGLVVIQADVQKDSFLAAFDVKDGREVWRASRADVPTWGTPTVHVVGGRTQLAVNGMRHAGGYDLKTGKEIWKFNGGGDIPVPTPVVTDGLIIITNAHGRGAPVYAVRETASGDVSLTGDATSNDGVAWSVPREGGYMCTPLVYKGLVYIVKFNGVLSAFDAKTGERKYQERLREGTAAFTGSPVASDGKIYLANDDGQVFVIAAGAPFKQLALNEMGGPVLTTPALSEGRLLIRTQSHLIAIGAK